MSTDGEREAFELAVAALSRKERTISELQAWLRAREVPTHAIETVLEHLVAIGELDDERFAQCFAADKRDLRGWGPERIRGALIERGVDAALADAVAGSEDDTAQAERAATLLRQRGSSLVDDRGRSKALAYLARRGYDYEVAYEAVRRATAA